MMILICGSLLNRTVMWRTEFTAFHGNLEFFFLVSLSQKHTNTIIRATERAKSLEMLPYFINTHFLIALLIGRCHYSWAVHQLLCVLDVLFSDYFIVIHQVKIVTCNINSYPIIIIVFAIIFGTLNCKMIYPVFTK